MGVCVCVGKGGTWWLYWGLIGQHRQLRVDPKEQSLPLGMGS